MDKPSSPHDGIVVALWKDRKTSYAENSMQGRT